MHRRLTAILLTLATLAGSLVAAAPAAAALNIICISSDNEMQCRVDVPSDRNLVSIQWFMDDVLYDNSGSSTTTVFSCTPGRRYALRFIMHLSPPPPPHPEVFTGSINPLCLGTRIANVYVGCSSGGSRMQCSVTWTGGTPWVSIRWTINGSLWTRIADVYVGCSSGGSRMQCSVTWTGGTPWVSIRWTINGSLWTTYNDRWWVDIYCNSPSIMSISVTVSDIRGGQTVSGSCFCHSGPLD